MFQKIALHTIHLALQGMIVFGMLYAIASIGSMH